jgi:hypothetical protein
MDGRNDDAANNRYGLRNREQSNREGRLSISGEGSGNEEEDKEEEDVGNRPHQRRRVDQADADDENLGEVLEVPTAIDYEYLALNREEGREGHEESNDQRGSLLNNQGQGGGGRGRTANNQGRGGGGRGGGGCGGGGRGGGGHGGGGLGGGGSGGYAQGNAATANNQGRGGGGLGEGVRGGTPQNHAGGRGHGGNPQGPCSSMETPLLPQVENSLRSYESPFNDPKQTAVMRSPKATIISLEHLVDNPSKVREPGEYMVCVILAITNKGVATTKGNNGRFGGNQQTTPYQRMIRFMCLNSDIGRNAFTMFYEEGTGQRMFNVELAQRDNGTFSEILLILLIIHFFFKTLIAIVLQGQELFLLFEIQHQSTGSWKETAIQ